MNQFEKELSNKIFTTYNEITKYFDVKVAMDKNNKYHLELEKKQGGKGKISKLDLLIQQFSEFKEQQEKFNGEMLKFKQNQEKFNEDQRKFNEFVVNSLNNQEKFNEDQRKFNEFVVEQFKQHGWTK